MKIKKIIVLPTLIFLLTGCSSAKHYSSAEYLMKLDFKNPHFNILQMSDIHLSHVDDLEYHFRFMDLTLKDAIKRCSDKGESLDFIVLNGDIFTYADKRTINEVFTFFDSYKIPWTFTYGNHDDQGYFNDHYIEETIVKYDYAMFKSLDDDVSGRSNFVIDLKGLDSHGNRETVYQLYFFDSHSNRFHDYMYYDYIKEDQIDWYKRMVEDTNPTRVKSSAFFHIPFPEYKYAKEMIEKDSGANIEGNGAKEGISSPRYNSGLFKAMKEMDSTISVHVAHDHINNFVVEYEGIKLCYGVKSTDRIYYDSDTLGGMMVSINPDYSSITTESIFHSYEELK